MGKYCYKCMKPLNEGEACTCGFDSQNYFVESYHLTPGTVLRDRYYIGTVLGEGGFGITYIGMDTVLERKIAVKEFFLNGYANRTNTISMEINTASGDKEKTYYNYLDKFLDEGKVMAKFSGVDGIVSIIDYFKLNNTAYIVMEFIEGETLKSYCKKAGRINYDNMLEIMIPVMNALEQIHNGNYIHRDISPDNIMITRNGSGRLLDFGAARNFDADGEKTLSVILKPGYAPEEQYRAKGKHGPWSDIYALCATMYYCLTGTAPSNAIERMVSDDVVPVHELASDCEIQFSDAIMKGMSVRWNDRYQSIAELRKALFEGEWNANSNTSAYATDGQISNLDKTQKITQMMDEPEYISNGYYENGQQGTYQTEGYPNNQQIPFYPDNNPNEQQIPFYPDMNQNGMQGYNPNYPNQYQQDGYDYNNYNYGNDVGATEKKSKVGVILFGIAAVVVALVLIMAVLGINSTASRVKKAIKQAESYLEEENYEDAIESYENAIELDADNSDAKDGLLSAYTEWIEKDIADGNYDKADERIKEAKEKCDDPSLDKLLVKCYDTCLDNLSIEGNISAYKEKAQEAFEATGDSKYSDTIKNLELIEASAAKNIDTSNNQDEKSNTGDPDFDDTVDALSDVVYIIEEVARIAKTGSVDDLYNYMKSNEFSPFMEKTSQMKTSVVYNTPSGAIGVYPVTNPISDYMFYYGDFDNLVSLCARDGSGSYFTYNNTFMHANGYWSNDVPYGDVEVSYKSTSGASQIQTGLLIDGLWDGDVVINYSEPNDNNPYTYIPNFSMGYMNPVDHNKDGLPIFSYCLENPDYYYYSYSKDNEFKTFGMPGFAELLL